jgi:hypothetical protein
MITVNLSKALKIKNRVAGELCRLQTIFARENSRRNDNASKVDRTSLHEEVQNKRKQLLQIKTAIATANVGIYLEIARMEELKSYKKFMSALPTKEGEELVNLNKETIWGKMDTLKEREKVVYVWDAFFNQEGLDGELKSLQSEMDACQDRIDEYNATNKAELDATE